MAITEARKEANSKWDTNNYKTISCRMTKDEAEELKGILTGRGMTAHTLLRNVCYMYIHGDDTVRTLLEPALTREERDVELDNIVALGATAHKRLWNGLKDL